MALAFAQNLGNLETGSGTSLSGTFGSSTVSGNAIIAAVRVGAIGRGPAVSDSKSNSYSQAASQQQASDGHELFVFYALNISGGASHQVTTSFGGASASIRMTLQEESGVATASAVDQTNSGSGSDASPVSGNVTTTQADELLFGTSSNGSGLVITVGSGYGHLVVSPASNPKLGSEDQIVSATGTYSATFTQSFGDFWACIIVTFKAAGGGGGGTTKDVVPTAVIAGAGVFAATVTKIGAIKPNAIVGGATVTATVTKIGAIKPSGIVGAGVFTAAVSKFGAVRPNVVGVGAFTATVTAFKAIKPTFAGSTIFTAVVTGGSGVRRRVVSGFVPAIMRLMGYTNEDRR